MKQKIQKKKATFTRILENIPPCTFLVWLPGNEEIRDSSCTTYKWYKDSFLARIRWDKPEGGGSVDGNPTVGAHTDRMGSWPGHLIDDARAATSAVDSLGGFSSDLYRGPFEGEKTKK